MTQIERRKEQRRANGRGGRRLEDWIPVRWCECEAPPLSIGSAEKFVWCKCDACGAVWAVREGVAAIRHH